MKPIAKPLVMLKLRGIVIRVRKEGGAMASSLQSISTTVDSISMPKKSSLRLFAPRASNSKYYFVFGIRPLG